MTLIIAMSVYALTLSISPGPVNMIILASGVQNGIYRTVPFILGATSGFTLLLYIIGAGGYAFLQQYPDVMRVANFLGTGFILYIGLKIMAAGGGRDMAQSRQPGFMEGAVLQWLNPKAWIASLSGTAAFVSGEGYGTLGVFCLIYFVLCYTGLSFWAVLGRFAQGFLNTPKHMRAFNILMGSSLCGVAIYLFLR